VLESKDSSQLVVARLLEFFAGKSAWFRGLWEVGPVLLLREAIEATQTRPTGALYHEHKALHWTGNGFMADHGILPQDRDLLKGLLESSLHLRGGQLPALERLTNRLESTYLEQWAAWLKAADEAKVKPERTARAVASHLLDAGFSPDFLHRWLTFRTLHDQEEHTLAGLVAEAHEMAVARPGRFTVLVPVNANLGVKSQPPRDWRDATAVSAWLAKHGFHTSLRQGGGWLLEVQARDAYAAAEQAAGIVERLSARLLIGAGHQQRHAERAYVVEDEPHEPRRGTEVPLRRRRRVAVRSLERQEQLFRYSGTPSQVDAAFELLAQLDGPDVVAVAAGWAAIEALLTTPDSKNKEESAERLARLVACSFPRAELTLLASLQMKMGSSPLRLELQGCQTNRERAIRMARALTSGQPPLSWASPDQRAAVARMVAVLHAPKPKLEDIKSHANRAFRRLYRQRNLVLHAGKTNSVALSASLRTAAPLIGAGIDRIAHAWFVHGVGPLELAVMAELRLALLKEKNVEPASLMDLLE
jgi:hypothetical protein